MFLKIFENVKGLFYVDRDAAYKAPAESDRRQFGGPARAHELGILRYRRAGLRICRSSASDVHRAAGGRAAPLGSGWVIRFRGLDFPIYLFLPETAPHEATALHLAPTLHPTP